MDWSWCEQVKEVSLCVCDLVPFTGALCPSGCHSVGICFVVLRLQVVPYPELVLIEDLYSVGH